MRNSSPIWSAALSLALVAGCSTSHPTDGSDTSGASQGAGDTEPGGGGGSGSGSGTAASCPLGVASFTSELGLAGDATLLDMAIDANGTVAVAPSVPPFFVTQLAGTFELSAAGMLLAHLPQGSVVAAAGHGDFIIAGSFTQAITLGGTTLTPEGNIDVFVAKIDARGSVLFVKQLGLCGDGIESLAVAADGRIAVSGTAMGTVILSPSGELELSLAISGLVAFDSHGNLVVAETLQAGVAVPPNVDVRGDQLVIEKLDAAGKVLFSQSFSGSVQVNGLAIGANDHIALVGYTARTIDLFGTTIIARYVDIGPGRTTGAFLVELDDTCGLVRVLDLGIVEANAVAFDAAGHVFIAGAYAGDTGFDRYLTAFGVDTRLPVLFPGGGDVNGRGTGIVADACGAVLVGYVKQDTPSALAPIRAFVQKVSP